VSNKKRILIIDGLNIFITNWIVNPTISENSGQPIGGVVGFIKILQKYIKSTKCSKVFVCWDSSKGSVRRKQIYKEYKENRKPIIKLNRFSKNMDESEVSDNKEKQQLRLISYLNEMPVSQFVEDGVEADDLIAYLCKTESLKDYDKVILSSDKDFYQLCDNSTIIVRPTQKEIHNKNTIKDKYKISPENFALARSIVGDSSDNIEGILGAGLKTIAKRFPFLIEDKKYFINNIIDYINRSEKQFKLFDQIKDNKDKLVLNFKITSLYPVQISFDSIQKIENKIKVEKIFLNVSKLRTMMMADGFESINWDGLFVNLRRIVLENEKR